MTTSTAIVADERASGDTGLRSEIPEVKGRGGDHAVAAIEFLLPISRIHPDPFQPRITCGPELADSIKSQGVLEAITVEPIQPLDIVCEHCGNTFIELAALGHWMINNGERRYRGSIAAKRTEILAKIIAPTQEGDRIKRQLTSNTGLPLTPLEEAIAFKRLMEVEGWSQVELAKQLGRPRATIGDRLRLVELHKAWLDLIHAGKLQVSHAPLIHVYAAVPDEYQEKAAAKLMDDYRAERHIDNDQSIPVAEFKRLLRVAFRDFIKRMGDVPGYKGPVIELEDEYGWSSRTKHKFAADPALWRPIHNKRENVRRRQQVATQRLHAAPASPPDAPAKSKPQKPDAAWGGLSDEMQVREAKSPDPDKKPDTEAVIACLGVWTERLDPHVLRERLQPADVVRVRVNGETAYLTTSRLDVVQAAREAFDGRVFAKAHVDEDRATVRALPADVQIRGAGIRFILPSLDMFSNVNDAVLQQAALLAGITLPMEDFGNEESVEVEKLPKLEATDDQWSTFGTAIAAIVARKLKERDIPQIRDSIASGLLTVPFSFGKKAKSA